MAPSVSPFADHSHTSDPALDSNINQWASSSLMSALGEPSSSQGIDVPHEWHISSDPLSEAPSCPSRLPSPPFTPDSYCASSSSSSASSPTFQSATPRGRKTTVSRRAKSPDHVPRPRNAFMIFRSEYCTDVKESQVEHDHRMISKILGQVWRSLAQEKKDYYKQLAVEEKRIHRIKHPNYRFSPQQRTEKPKKRNVKRNGATDKQRCDKVAKLLLEGKGGNALKAEVEKFDLSIKSDDGAASDSADYSTGVFDPRTWVSPSGSGSSSGSSTPSTCPPITPTFSDSPAFRSPLLRPSVPRTPSVRSPLDIPSVANFETHSPLSPLCMSSSEHQAQAPVLAPVPLPPVGEQSSPILDYPSLYASSLTGLGLDVSQPQGELKIGQMYSPRTTAVVVHAQEYDYHNAPFSEQLASPLDPTIPAPSSFSYTYGAAAQYVTGETQRYPQPFVFPPGSTCIPVPEAAHAGDATGSLNAWPPYGQNAELDVSSQGEPQPAAGWIRY
ncbi:hypothetical protein BN946_scf184829.g43 [Trametes cinnabarina]|uniref:HMG box domain-containing protein n=1 Tax=Pycnoporus cinnabarinus TaxID=5643 RepID=A0A060SFB6_PYCCI|nr:hypothetical protein BN946_scf184829.g43 [Trametes cinnabarina]